MEEEVMSPFILSVNVQGRAGSWLHGEQREVPAPPSPVQVSVQGESGLPRGTGWWEQGAGDLCPHHQRALVCCRTVPPELLWLIPWEGSQLQPRRDWRTSHPRPEFSSFSVNVLPKLFSRKFVPQPTVLPGWSSVKCKKHIETNSTIQVFCLGFWEFKRRIQWLCCWVSIGWMWFLNVISVVKLYTELWCLMSQSIKAGCYARNDVVALCGLLGISKMGQKYQEKV